jgi:hypothetical protein
MSDQQEDDTTTLPPTTPLPTSTRDTGPLASVGGSIRGIWEHVRGPVTPKQPRPGRQQNTAERPAPKSDIATLRDKLAEFDEDYRDIGERLLGFSCQIVGYLGPFMVALWVGMDLGKYYTPVMDITPAYGLAFTIEAIIAASSVAMGRAFAEIGSGKANFGKMVMVVVIWVTLNTSSAIGLYLVITNNGNVAPGIEQTGMVVRVLAIALADLGCAAVLMFKGRSIQKHIESIRKRATAIGELADAQRSIEEADKNAAQREQQMKATLKIQEEFTKSISEAVGMVMGTVLAQMKNTLDEEKNKNDRDKNERGYGRRN